MQGRTAAVSAPEVLLRHVIDAWQDLLQLDAMVGAGEECHAML